MSENPYQPPREGQRAGGRGAGHIGSWPTALGMFAFATLLLPATMLLVHDGPSGLVYLMPILALAVYGLSAVLMPLPWLARPLVFVAGVIILAVEFFVIGLMAFHFTGFNGMQ